MLYIRNFHGINNILNIFSKLSLDGIRTGLPGAIKQTMQSKNYKFMVSQASMLKYDMGNLSKNYLAFTVFNK
jgi:hypothetical protein